MAKKYQLYVAERKKGKTYQEIADQFGVTRQCVHAACTTIHKPRKPYGDIPCVYPVLRNWLEKDKRPKKGIASRHSMFALAFALNLFVDETKDFIGRAGFALSHSSKFDVIVEYFLVNRNYNVFELNEVLFAFDQPLIGV